MWSRLQCIGCGKSWPLAEERYQCKECGDLLEVVYDLPVLSKQIDRSAWEKRRFGVWRYRELIPVGNNRTEITLGEGGTNLYECKRLGEELGLPHLYVKNEGENPTGSFKDRGMTVGVTRALEIGVRTVVCASTGNTSASLAAYTARAGLRCVVLIPTGKIAFGKLAQAMIHGALVVQVQGNFDEALNLVFQLCRRHKEAYLLNSVNPFRLEGQKTLAYEVWEQSMGTEPDVLVTPVGNAGNISAIWKGFSELNSLGFLEKLPRLFGVQAEGAAPIAESVKKGRKDIIMKDAPETIATAIRIGAPISWKKALRAIYGSNGGAEIVSDEEILTAQRLLARYEGLFVEPASASPIAALKKMLNAGMISRSDRIVCVATGHGLKDPDAVTHTYEPPLEIKAELSEIEKLLGVVEVPVR
tara:strand:+ start:17210 stop:18454 length:1245 start_codon:yes stop_codon:yes gene_type:complete